MKSKKPQKHTKKPLAKKGKVTKKKCPRKGKWLKKAVEEKHVKRPGPRVNNQKE